MARTPSAAAHQKVLDAAIDLIAEKGFDGASMDAIVRASGVSKATVYKHWKDKDALCIDVIRQFAGTLPEFDSGNPWQDLGDLLRHLANTRKPDRLMKLWPRIMSQSAASPRFAGALQEFAFGPRREQFNRILKRAAAAGQLRPGMDTDFAQDMLIGPILHRRMASGGPGGKPVPPVLVDRVVDSFWQLWGVSPSKQRR